jgi:hypothetical protein
MNMADFSLSNPGNRDKHYLTGSGREKVPVLREQPGKTALKMQM